MFVKETALKSFTKSQLNIGGSFLIKVHTRGFQLYQKETLAKVLSRELFQIFHDSRFIDQLRVDGSVFF